MEMKDRRWDGAVFEMPEWWRSQYVAERSTAIEREKKVDRTMAEERWAAWSKKPFDDAKLLELRLAADGLSREQCFELLGESSESLQQRFPHPPPWLLCLQRILEAPEQQVRFDLDAYLASKTSPLVGFLNWIKPLLVDGISRLEAGFENRTEPSGPVISHDAFIKAWLNAFIGKLVDLVNRTMVLELNVARVQKRLEGSTPEDRFAFFIQRLNDPQMRLALMIEYPVLTRCLVEVTGFWVENGLELFNRLHEDWQEITGTFFKAEHPGVLSEIRAQMGDSHNHGKTVVGLEFEKGQKLIYKPRSLAVDTQFQKLLLWLNERGDHPPFRILKVLDKDSHGWVEHVAAESCRDEVQVRRFYQRQGAYLAVLYALDANDFHGENLIAAGEHPVLIDLESLFQPRMAEDLDGDIRSQAGFNMAFSVLRIGLLPQIGFREELENPYDGSGMNTRAQMSPIPVIRWEDLGKDTMRVVFKRIPMIQRPNAPVCGGERMGAVDFSDEIEAAFAHTYRLILSHREEFLAGHGPLVPFGPCFTRVVFRGTLYYEKVIRQSYHPHFLGDALERDRYTDRLWGGVPQYSPLARVVPHEKRDILHGDIPFFQVHPDERHVWTVSGVRLENLLGESPMDTVRGKIEAMGDRDLELQRWLIRGSLTAFIMDQGHHPWGSYQPKPVTEGANAQELMDMALVLGERLRSLAFEGEDQISWAGVALISERFWSLTPLRWDLYNGLPGVVLFLAYLAQCKRGEHFRGLAEKGLAAVEDMILKDDKYIEIKSRGISGVGGLVYLFTHLGALWGENRLLERANSLVKTIRLEREWMDRDDIIDGWAGILLPMLGLHRLTPDEELLALGRLCGDSLLDRAKKMDQGLGWENGGGAPLAGFSHGGSGIAYALAELAAVTGEPRYRDAAMAALDYESGLYSEKAGNWLDLREKKGQPTDESGQPQFMTAWCHGAPGIGLARAKMLVHLDEPRIRSDLMKAVDHTMRAGFGLNHSLCHGDLGNLELLLQAGQVLNDSALLQKTYRVAAMILANIRRDGWKGGVPLGVETPGLMTGLSGIGHGLLRLAKPEVVPSVLALEPPVWRNQIP